MMKNKLKAFVIVIPLIIPSCTFFKTDEEEYKTPELFCFKAEGYEYSYDYYSSRDGSDYELDDYDGTVLEELKKIKDYQSVSRKEDKTENYIVYQNIIPAMSGPNIARMSIYDDGYLEIYRKQSLGNHHYFAYTIDIDLAKFIIQYVEDKIDFAKTAEEEAYEKANQYAYIENFLIDSKKETAITNSAVRTGYGFTHFQDKTTINLIEKYQYELVEEETFNYEDTYFKYDVLPDVNNPERWTFELDKKFGSIYLTYEYKDAANRDGFIKRKYSMNKNDASSLYEEILELKDKQ